MSEANLSPSPPIRLLAPPSRVVDNTAVWLFALVSIPGGIVDGVFGISSSSNRYLLQLGYFGLFFALRELDKKNFQAAGVEPPSVWWMGLPPGYLWRRATILKQSRLHFWVMLAAMVVGGLINVLIDP